MTGMLDFVLLKMLKDRRERRFCLQQVLTSLDHQQIAAAVNEPANLFAIRVFQITICNMPERRQLSSRPDRTGDKSRLIIRRIIACDPFCKFRRFLVYIVGLVRNAKLGQHDLAAAKAVCLDHVAANIQKRRVNRLDRIRPRV